MISEMNPRVEIDFILTTMERFFDLIHVLDASAAILKRLYNVLARHNLSIENIRCLGYDGASNMRGE